MNRVFFAVVAAFVGWQAALKKSMEDALRKYGSLKQSADPRVVQEAKNALADIKWAMADL